MITNPVVVVRQLMDASGRFHHGASEEDLLPWLTEDVVWHVPGVNAIAGTYRGLEEVLAYFRRRRDQAGRSLRFTERRVLVANDLVLHFAAAQSSSTASSASGRRWASIA